jgi:hypothetical protein
LKWQYQANSLMEVHYWSQFGFLAVGRQERRSDPTLSDLLVPHQAVKFVESTLSLFHVAAKVASAPHRKKS